MKKKELSTTQIILLGFLCAIIIGTVLLSLPICSASGKGTPFIDALFTSTTSICVTGLVTLDTYAHWSFFGQFIILLLAQIGGLGVVSITTGVMLVIGQKVSLKDRLLIESAFNLSSLKGIIRFFKRIIIGTFLVEGIGAICYAFVFVPEFGWKKGIWASIFNGVSAFCNAGMDVIGANSLAPYVSNVWINIVTMILIILGGLGFVVWWDIIRVFKLVKNKKLPLKWMFNKCTLQTKIVLTMTLVLILSGAICIFVLEYHNPETLGTLSFGDKILASFFQSVTTRTAGFFTISQKGLRDSTILICLVLMFIGGSPSGIAGGVKTTTIALLLIATKSIITGTEEAEIFNRSIPLKTIRKALAVVLISFLSLWIGTVALLAVSGGSLSDVAFEMTSAVATVGLTRGFTSSLNTIGKLIVIVGMYLGRIGPISLAIAIQGKKKKGLASFAKEDVTVG